MTRSEMLTKLRVSLSDEQKVGFPSDDELLGYLDRATIYYSEHMISAKDPSMLKRLPVVGCMELPDDFVALAGLHPVQITGRHMDYYGEQPYQIIYYATMSLPSSFGVDEEITHPFGADIIILDLGRAFALNRNEYDLSQDLKLIEGWQASAKGART